MKTTPEIEPYQSPTSLPPAFDLREIRARIREATPVYVAEDLTAQLKESLASIGRLSVLLGTVSAKGLGASIPTILELAQEITEKAREVAQLVEMKERTS
jgi:hypothetical protein